MDRELRAYRDSLPGMPEHFAYYGNYTDWERWRYIGVGQHRDSDALERSNFEIISEEFENKVPDGYIVERSSNWAVGWSEGIRVDTENAEALGLALDWKMKLDDYPIADEEHFSKLEQKEIEERWESFGKGALIEEIEERQDETLTLLMLDEDGDADGFRDERADKLVHGAFVDNEEQGGRFEDAMEKLYDVAEEYRIERALGKRQAFEKYQLTIEEA